MKWPRLDLSDAAHTLQQTLRRFPLAGLAALAACGFALLAINDSLWRQSALDAVSDTDLEQQQLYLRMMLAAATGIPLLTGARLLSEQVIQRGAGRFAVLVPSLAALVLEVLLFAHAYDKPAREDWFVLEMLFFHVAAQGWAAGAAYLLSGRESDFWQLNQRFFLRFFTSTLYAGTLWVGLAGALGVVDALFDITLNYRIYPSLLAVLALVFHPIFFLAGVPAAQALYQPTATPYPKPLKAFAQFVLLPLVVIYLLILYAYMARILVLQTWPQGLVSWLVFGFAIAGILAFLLLWPLRREGDTVWVQRYTQLFYGALVPLIVLEGLAIYQRVHAYGLTPERVILIVLTAWLAGITATGLLTHGHRIRYIPLSLAVVLVLPFVGPWGAVPLSIASQQRRMMAWFEKHGMLQGGKLRPYSETKGLNDKDIQDLRSQLDFLQDAHALRPALAGILPDGSPLRDTLSRAEDSKGRRAETGDRDAARVFQWLHFPKLLGDDRAYYHSPWIQSKTLDTRGARQVVYIGNVERVVTDSASTASYRLKLVSDDALLIAKGRERQVISLKTQIETLARQDSLPDSLQVVPFRLPDAEGYVYLNELTVHRAPVQIVSVEVLLLVR